MPELIRVLIADDHPAARAGVRVALEGQGFEICAEVEDAPQAIGAALRERPDICLLDVYMPGGGVAAARRIVQLLPEVAVVMLTVSSLDEDVLDALRAGVAGYLLKDTDPERLSAILRDVRAGSPALPRPLVKTLMRELRGPTRRRSTLDGEHAAELTDRELQILELAAAGHSTGAIAQRLAISTVTVRRHLSHAMRKLRADDREHALRLFAELRTAEAAGQPGGGQAGS